MISAQHQAKPKDYHHTRAQGAEVLNGFPDSLAEQAENDAAWVNTSQR
jgi:hypothetical protein